MKEKKLFKLEMHDVFKLILIVFMRVNEDIAYLLDFDNCINVCELLDVGTWKKCDCAEIQMCERYKIHLKKSLNILRWNDVPDTINNSVVHFRNRMNIFLCFIRLMAEIAKSAVN